MSESKEHSCDPPPLTRSSPDVDIVRWDCPVCGRRFEKLRGEVMMMARRRRSGRRPNRTAGHVLHVVVAAVRKLVDGWRHALTSGASTRRRARGRAEAPPRPCPTCHRPMPHSDDWRDHIGHHPTWTGRPTDLPK